MSILAHKTVSEFQLGQTDAEDTPKAFLSLLRLDTSGFEGQSPH